MIKIHYENGHKLVLLPLLDQRFKSIRSPTTSTPTGLAKCVTRESEITTSSPTITEFYTKD